MNPTLVRKVARQFMGTSPPTARASDAELLVRFLDSHDEQAFEALVFRHLPAVRAVCGSVLRDPHDADDAVQATFLVLVRRANVVRNRAALGAWLRRVAWRAANRLRGENIRRSARQDAGIDPDSVADRSGACPDLERQDAVREEIGRLPERYRLAVQACYLAGTRTADAARNFGWSRGTLLTRLAWARRRLKSRLTARGFTLSAGLTALAADVGRLSAHALEIARIAVALAVGDPLLAELVSERSLSTSKGVVNAMIGSKLKIVVGMAFAAVAVLSLGIGRMTSANAEPTDKEKRPLTTAKTAPRLATEEHGERAEANLPAAPAKDADLVIRRPLGRFTKELPGIGTATVTFADRRIQVVATFTVEKETFTLNADADFDMNRDSMVYGIITGAEVAAGRGSDSDTSATLAGYSALLSDMPFAFRVRVDDDVVQIKDIKFGMIGSPLFKREDGSDELKEIVMLVSGKYKAEAKASAPPKPYQK